MKMNTPFLREVFVKRYLCIILLIISNYLRAQVVTVSGNWNPSLPVITEAGNNYTGTYDNTTTTINPITLSATLPGNFLNLLSGTGAKMTMHYTTNAWHSSLGLAARRTGGTGSVSGFCLICSATINGGAAFVPIQQMSDSTLVTLTFGGLLGINNTANFSDINLIIQLSGVSVTIPATTYSARIVFTIVAN
ncbi:hypothetical protein EG359_12850 [Chryseobacterium joostei]|uniref:Uncharacterized protein n=1 Tax=Chryseobacterium joostei TaxID=112234 RepID=A0A1N7IIK3_9FLAO|nr:hypothetical protein [Chryseobacterium joostei]AZB00456.1 hypothetical protein EG359_12850 [Chryseobacterium joostei]SIS36909.1 hypothetical protein SAMN05421768_105501 [Chryseobacterium joostei]